MKNEVNRTLAVKKKQYIYPATSVSPLYLTSNLLNVSADGRADMTEIETNEQW